MCSCVDWTCSVTSRPMYSKCWISQITTLTQRDQFSGVRSFELIFGNEFQMDGTSYSEFLHMPCSYVHVYTCTCASVYSVNDHAHHTHTTRAHTCMYTRT